MHELSSSETFPRCAGLSLNPMSLGEGQALGRPAHRLLTFLIRSGLSYWHTPGTLAQDEGDRALSLTARDPRLIDLSLLVSAKLCAPGESAETAARALATNSAHPFRTALAQFRERSLWANAWGLYAALRDAHGALADWPQPLKDRDGDALTAAGRKLREEIDTHVALQFFIDMQWQIIRVMGHDTGVRMVTDLPAILSPNAFEVWQAPTQWSIGEAGATPAARRMVNDGFRVYRQALRAALHDADLIRVTPASALASGAVSLIDAWRTLRRDLPIIPYDDEPIGSGRDALQRSVRLPQSVVLSSAFGGDAAHPALLHHIEKNSVIFTSRPEGAAFEDALRADAQAHARMYLGVSEGPLTPSLVAAALRTVAQTVFLDARDLSTMGALPTADDDGDELAEHIGTLIRLTDRDELTRLRDRSMRDGSPKARGPHSPRGL